MPETGTGKAQEPAGTEREAEGGRGGERGTVTNVTNVLPVFS